MRPSASTGGEHGSRRLLALRQLPRPIIVTVLLGLLPISLAPGQALVPPPPPDVPPLIGRTYANDSDANRIDDALEARAAQAAASLQIAGTPQAAHQAQAQLNALVDVELIFQAPVTQQQINHFLALGGQIDYLYKAVSYGWNGQVPLGRVTAVAASMGATLVLLDESKPVTLHMDMATRTGRVRPVWAPGFAGNPAGFDGDTTITIAVVDTGLDASHTDLAGRQAYWKDFTSDGFLSPTDLIQHGSHVAGIALGSGAASGAATGTLYYTRYRRPDRRAVGLVLSLADRHPRGTGDVHLRRPLAWRRLDVSLWPLPHQGHQRRLDRHLRRRHRDLPDHRDQLLHRRHHPRLFRRPAQQRRHRPAVRRHQLRHQLPRRRRRLQQAPRRRPRLPLGRREGLHQCRLGHHHLDQRRHR